MGRKKQGPKTAKGRAEQGFTDFFRKGFTDILGSSSSDTSFDGMLKKMKREVFSDLSNMILRQVDLLHWVLHRRNEGGRGSLFLFTRSPFLHLRGVDLSIHEEFPSCKLDRQLLAIYGAHKPPSTWPQAHRINHLLGFGPKRPTGKADVFPDITRGTQSFKTEVPQHRST
jgi:hypothetical protein